MNITELASLILENCKNPHNRNLKYIKGLINEQLHLRSYNKLLKEIEEPEDEEQNIEDQEPPEIVLAEPEDKGIERGLDPLLNPGEKPELETEPEAEVELEPEEEPKATVDTTPISTPKTISTPRKGPAAKVEPGVEPKIKTISVQEARELLSYKGKIGNIIFTKKDGTRRAMNFMTGVRKFTSGGQLRYSPKEKGVIPVYDLKIGNGPKGYRMINIDGIESIKMDGQQYKVDHSLQEIKINRPNTEDNFKDIVNLIRSKEYNLAKGLVQIYGYKDGDKFLDFYKNLNPLDKVKLIKLLNKLPNRELQEIKVLSPQTPSIKYIDTPNNKKGKIEIKFPWGIEYGWLLNHNGINNYLIVKNKLNKPNKFDDIKNIFKNYIIAELGSQIIEINLNNYSKIIQEIKVNKPELPYKIMKSGKGHFIEYRIGKIDGSELVDMTFDNEDDAKKYANKKGLKLIKT